MAMKILIVSDSHGNNRNLIQAVKNMSGTMDMMIHLQSQSKRGFHHPEPDGLENWD